ALVGFRGVAARQETSAGSGNGGTRGLCIFRQCVRIGDGTIAGNPVNPCHCDLFVITGNTVERDQRISCPHCTQRALVSFPLFAVTSVPFFGERLMIRVLAFIGLLAVLAAIAAAVFFFGGFYSVAGRAGDPAVVKWSLAHIRAASIARHARDNPT